MSGGRDDLLTALEQAGHQAERIGETVRVTIEGDEAVGVVLELAREHDARIREVAPRKESLEDLVVKQAEAN